MHTGRSRAHPPLTPVRLAHAMLAQASSSALASLSYSAKKRKSSAAKKKRTSHASRDATWTYKNVSNKCVALRETASFPSRVTGFGIVPDQVVCVDKRLDKSVRGIKVRYAVTLKGGWPARRATAPFLLSGRGIPTRAFSSHVEN